MIPFYENRNDEVTVFKTSDLDYPKHLHSEFEILYVKKGQVIVTCANQAYNLNTGDLFLAFPNEIHAYNTISENNNTQLILLIFSTFLAGSQFNTIQNKSPVIPVLKKQDIHLDIPSAANSALNEFLLDNPNTLAIQSYIQLILSRILPKISLIKSQNDNELIPQILSYISENFQSPLTLDEIAKNVGVSPSYLSRIFNSSINIRLDEHINSLRINLAKQLLISTNWDISQISQYCGWSTQRTFNRVFKNYCNCTPREYRNSNL